MGAGAALRSVCPDHLPLGQPFHAGQFNVLAVQGIEHRGPNQPHQSGDPEQTQRHGRQHIGTGSRMTRGRHRIQCQPKNPDEHQPKPERWSRLPDQRQCFAAIVENGIPFCRRNDTHGNRNQRGDRDRQPCERPSRRQSVHHQLTRGHAPLERLAELSLQCVSYEGEILDVQSPVHAPC